YRTAAQDQALKQQALAVNQFIANRAYGLKAQGQAFGQAATKARINQGAAKIKAQKDRFEQQYRLYFARVFGVDPTTGTPSLQARVAASRAAELETKRRARAANGGFTAGQRQHLRQLAAETARE